MMTIKILDETPTGKLLQQTELKIGTGHHTLKEIIRLRIFAEVEKFNIERKNMFFGLVQPKETEKTLNGYKMSHFREIDAEKQYYLALEQFQRNGYFILIDNLQETELEKEITVQENTKISFVKLTPLVGG